MKDSLQFPRRCSTMLARQGNRLFFYIFLLATLSCTRTAADAKETTHGIKPTPIIKADGESIKTATVISTATLKSLETRIVNASSALPATINATEEFTPLANVTVSTIKSNNHSTINVTKVQYTTSHVTVTAQPIKHSTTAKPGQKGTSRKFDGLSFFGGIILGATICVILFFAIKYYHAKKRSYHSL